MSQFNLLHPHNSFNSIIKTTTWVSWDFLLSLLSMSNCKTAHSVYFFVKLLSQCQQKDAEKDNKIQRVHDNNCVETWVPQSVSSRPSSWALLLSLLSLYCPCLSVFTPSPSPLSYHSLSPPPGLSTSSIVAHGLLGPHNCQETCGLPGAFYTAVPLVVNLTQFLLLWRYTEA